MHERLYLRAHVSAFSGFLTFSNASKNRSGSIASKVAHVSPSPGAADKVSGNNKSTVGRGEGGRTNHFSTSVA